MSDYSKVPSSATLKPTPFEVKIDDATLNELKTLLKSAKLPKDTYENETEDGTFGVSKGWVSDTVDYWAEHFDWRQREARINSFPHFKVPIKDDDGTVYDIHFVALFSQKQDALPLLFFHGWPGSFLEFLPLLDLLRTKYTPETLPYHIIVPSIPGFTHSELPVLERDFSLKDVARLFNSLVLGLGFERYVVQGGDLGSGVATLIGSTYPACKAVHLNCSFTPPPEGFDFSTLTDKQKAGLARGQEFHKTGMAYAIMHATRPSTIGIVLSSSPVALLAWIGEKFVAWSDETPSLDAILESITLYWATNTYPSSIYAYREWLLKPRVPQIAADGKPETYIHTYLGYSNFPKELGPQPKEWIERNGNLVSYKDHDKGGHFAALEEPEQLLKDVEEFISIIREKI